MYVLIQIKTGIEIFMKHTVVYNDREDAERQQKICGTTNMAKWVVRTVTDWENIDREQLTT